MCLNSRNEDKLDWKGKVKVKIKQLNSFETCHLLSVKLNKFITEFCQKSVAKYHQFISMDLN